MRKRVIQCFFSVKERVESLGGKVMGGGLGFSGEFLG